MLYKNKVGFTLAEVLITMGIIGVVAAITMPTIIHNVQMKVLQTQFKKVYSVISNAVEKARVDSDYSLRCYGDDTVADCKEFHDLLESQLKIIKICNSNSYVNGCIGDIKGIDKVTPDAKSSKDISNYNMFFNSSLPGRYVFLTSSGFSFGYYYRSSRNIYFVDINGLKRPNKWGYDVFSFSLDSENTKLICSPKLQNFFEQGGKSCIDMITNKK